MQHLERSRSSTDLIKPKIVQPTTLDLLLNSYKEMKSILYPTLNPKKQKILQLSLEIITDQITKYTKILSAMKLKSLTEEISLNKIELSKGIANLLNEYNDPPLNQSFNSLQLSVESNFSLLQNNANTSSSSICPNKSIKTNTKSSLLNNNNKSLHSRKIRSNISNSTKLKRFSKSNSSIHISADPNSSESNNNFNNYIAYKNNIFNNYKNHSISAQKKQKKLCKTVKNKNNLSNKIQYEKNFTLYNKKSILDYGTFIEKTEKNYEKDTKPSNYTKYLVQKFKNVVAKFEKINNEDLRRSECNHRYQNFFKRTEEENDKNSSLNISKRKNEEKILIKSMNFSSKNKLTLVNVNDEVNQRLHVNKAKKKTENKNNSQNESNSNSIQSKVKSSPLSNRDKDKVKSKINGDDDKYRNSLNLFNNLKDNEEIHFKKITVFKNKKPKENNAV